MAGRTLSIFIDESGDFGAYEEHSPYYIVSVVLHNQNIDISEDIDKLENYLSDIQERRVIHTGPLIRRGRTIKITTLRAEDFCSTQSSILQEK